MVIKAWKKGCKAEKGVQYVRLFDFVDGVDLALVNEKGDKLDDDNTGGPYLFHLDFAGVSKYGGVSTTCGVKLNIAGKVKTIS